MAENYFVENNCFHNLNPLVVDKEFRLAIEFLKHHPISKAFNKQGDSPKNRMVALYNSMTVKKNEEGQFVIKGNLAVNESEDYPVVFTKSDLNRVLEWNDVGEGREEPKLETMVDWFKKLKFRLPDSITTPSQILRKHMPLIYQFLFNLILKCLTGKKGSGDQASLPILQIFACLIKVKDFDLGQLLIHAMKLAYEKKGQTTHIMYVRFLSILVADKLRSMDITWPKEENTPNFLFSGRFSGSGEWPKEYLEKEEMDTINTRMLRTIPDNSRIKRSFLGEAVSEEPLDRANSPSQTVSFSSRIQGKNTSYPIEF